MIPHTLQCNQIQGNGTTAEQYEQILDLYCDYCKAGEEQQFFTLSGYNTTNLVAICRQLEDEKQHFREKLPAQSSVRTELSRLVEQELASKSITTKDLAGTQLSVRYQNFLYANGITALGDLRNQFQLDLTSRIANFGTNGIKECKKILIQYGAFRYSNFSVQESEQEAEKRRMQVLIETATKNDDDPKQGAAIVNMRSEKGRNHIQNLLTEANGITDSQKRRKAAEKEVLKAKKAAKRKLESYIRKRIRESGASAEDRKTIQKQLDSLIGIYPDMQEIDIDEHIDDFLKEKSNKS